jgi:hypothetical protein
MHVRNKTPKATGFTTEDTEMENCLSKATFTLQKGGQARGHSTHNISSLIFLTRLTLPLDLDWARSKVHNLFHWLKFYTNSGDGLRYTAWRAIFMGKGA